MLNNKPHDDVSPQFAKQQSARLRRLPKLSRPPVWLGLDAGSVGWLVGWLAGWLASYLAQTCQSPETNARLVAEAPPSPLARLPDLLAPLGGSLPQLGACFLAQGLQRSLDEMSRPKGACLRWV